jgi:hypothetical protein
VAGAGIEWAFHPQLDRADYDYSGLRNVTVNPFFTRRDTFTVNRNVQITSFGMN